VVLQFGGWVGEGPIIPHHKNKHVTKSYMSHCAGSCEHGNEPLDFMNGG
jgi:hypothetical protein